MSEAPQPTRSRRIAKRILRATLYLLYLTAIVALLVYFAFHRPLVRDLRARLKPADDEITAVGPVDAETMRDVGSLRVDRADSFVRFPEDKNAGTVRLCAFGDSFTYGDEVGPAQDFPAQLGRLFREAGVENVEVLNFGSPWHGFHQTYRLWDRVGRRYRCDEILLGPGSFWPKRETEFNHTNLVAPYYLHARYVLDGDDVRLVRPIGRTNTERFDAYFGFLPRLRYLRFDRNPPAFLRGPLRARTVPNPFYYRNDRAEEEADRTYRILLKRLAAETRHVTLLHRRSEIVALARELDLDNRVAAPALDEPRFPYLAPKGHSSGRGNELVARQFFAHLVSGAAREARIPVAEALSAVADPRVAPRPLSEFRSLEVTIDDVPAGLVVTASPNVQELGLGRADEFWGGDVAFLLALVEPGATALDGALVPLAFLPDKGVAVTLHAADGTETALGAVTMPATGAPIGVVESETLRFRERQELVSDHGAGAELRIDGRAVLRATGGAEGAVWLPTFDRLYRFSPTAALDEAPRNTAEEGVYGVRLIHPDAGTLDAALARWRLAPVRLVGDETPAGTILVEDGAARVAP